MKKYSQILLVFIVATIGWLYYEADYKTEMYRNIYWMWDKIKDLLFAIGITYSLKGRIRTAWIVVSAFLFFRLLWQSFEIVNYKYANNPFFLYLLFLALGIATFVINIIAEKRNKKYDSKDGRN